MILMGTDKANLKVTIAGIEMKNPLMAASGTFGFGEDFIKVLDFNNEDLGAIVLKGTTLAPRQGNPPPRIVETPAGILNSIGLQNPGLEKVIKECLPKLKSCGARVILNIAGFTIEDYGEIAKRLAEVEGIDGLEINISCPNVKEGGIQFGSDPRLTSLAVREVRKSTSLPVIIKLSPNVTDIKPIALACMDEGANAISLINTVQGMAIDIWKRSPILGSNVGGLSGPAIKPIALLKVHQLYQLTRGKIPIVGMGGISSAEDVLEFIIAGANAVAIGTGLMVNPYLIKEILQKLPILLAEMDVRDITELVGSLTLNPN